MIFRGETVRILLPRATAPSSVTTRKARDVKTARTFPYEKRTEYFRVIQRCLEQCRSARNVISAI